MDSETVERLRSMYDSVDDIDPYTGLVSETPVTSSGILGPTATCVIAEQFLRLKKGDRFWYETPQAPQAFTPGNQYHCLLAKVGIINLFSIASRTTR